jgi:hypothetical protein
MVDIMPKEWYSVFTANAPFCDSVNLTTKVLLPNAQHYRKTAINYAGLFKLTLVSGRHPHYLWASTSYSAGNEFRSLKAKSPP